MAEGLLARVRLVLERAKTPNKERIVDAIRRICNVNGS